MATSPSLREDLAASIRRSLLPQRFPVRRDVELAGGVRDGENHVAFFDHFWIDQHILAATVTRVREGGLPGATSAAAIRPLLRAVMAKVEEPRSALSHALACSQTGEFDAACARLDITTGHTTWASAGEAATSLLGDQELVPNRPLKPGDLVWLAVGDVPAPARAAIPVDGLQAVVDPALIRASAGSAACALLFKARVRPDRSATFVVSNDQAEIAALLQRAARFFERHELDQKDVAGIDVALEEILTNAVNYGFMDGHRHEILVSITAELDRLRIEVRDDGVPFDPLSVPEPDLSADVEDRRIGGLGLHFVRSLLDKVDYERSNGWNVLTLEKTLKRHARQRAGP